MPILKGAKKALRQTKSRSQSNSIKKTALRSALMRLRKEKKVVLLNEVYKLADKAAKAGVIHKNKAARIKSAASKLVPTSIAKKTSSKTKSKK